jgi:putative ABC transport system permease protein
LGLCAGLGIGATLTAFVPGLETSVQPWMVISALVMALLVGLASGVAPAQRAAQMNPVDALREE